MLGLTRLNHTVFFAFGLAAAVCCTALPARAQQSIRHGGVEFLLEDTSDQFSLSIERPAGTAEPDVQMRTNPTRLVVAMPGGTFEGGKSFRLKGASVAGVYFVDRTDEDMVVIQIAAESRVLFQKDAVSATNTKLSFDLQPPEVADGSVAPPEPQTTPQQTAQTTEEFLNGVGKVLMPHKSSAIEDAGLEGLELVEIDDQHAIDKDTLERLTNPGPGQVVHGPHDRVLRIQVEPPKQAEPQHPDWVIPVLLSTTGLSWAITFLVVWLDMARRNRRKKRRKPVSEQPLNDAWFGGRRPPRRSQRDVLAECYSTLGLKSTDSDDDIKSRYKHLAKIFHEDTLGSRDLPEEMVHLANEQFRKIQNAYEAVKQQRGMH